MKVRTIQERRLVISPHFLMGLLLRDLLLSPILWVCVHVCAPMCACAGTCVYMWVCIQAHGCLCVRAVGPHGFVCVRTCTCVCAGMHVQGYMCDHAPTYFSSQRVARGGLMHVTPPPQGRSRGRVWDSRGRRAWPIAWASQVSVGLRVTSTPTRFHPGTLMFR